MFGKSKSAEADKVTAEVRRAHGENEAAVNSLLSAFACAPVPVYRNPQPLARQGKRGH